MTTIAYKGNQIAVDSRITRGSTICSDSYCKIQTVQDIKFIICGVLSDTESLIQAYFGAEVEDADAQCLILKEGRVYSFAIEDGKGYCLDITGETEAIGSGADHAITAMDLGLSAKEAVKMAAKRDTGTGGRIRVLEVK